MRKNYLFNENKDKFLINLEVPNLKQFEIIVSDQ